MTPFDPLFRNGHLATIATVGVRAHLDAERFAVNDRLFQTEPGVRIRVVSQYPEMAPRGHVVLVHGLEGSSEASYMRSLAQHALVHGFAAHRMNMRNCGGTEAHCRTLYHSGLTVDIEAFLRSLRVESPGELPLFLVGFSLGGNQASKLAGVLGERGRDLLAGVTAISTPIDLELCSRCVQSPSNWLYQWQFVYRMKRTIRRKHELMPDFISLNGIDKIRTIWELDDAYIAPFAGFRDAAHYYSVESAQNYLADVRIPMLMIHAADDPFIPISIYDQPAVTRNPHIRFLPVAHGGHMGFIARKAPHFWANETILEWIEGLLAPKVVSSIALTSA